MRELIQESRNKEYQAIENLSCLYIDAWLFIKQFVQYGHPLYNYTHDLVEIAFRKDYGAEFYMAYNSNIDEYYDQFDDVIRTLVRYYIQIGKFEDAACILWSYYQEKEAIVDLIDEWKDTEIDDMEVNAIWCAVVSME